MSSVLDLRSLREGYCPPEADREFLSVLWNRSAFCCAGLQLIPGSSCAFTLGTAALPVLEEDEEYAVSVTETGAAVAGRSTEAAVRGFLALLARIRMTEPQRPFLDTGTFRGKFSVAERMVHLCVFPETTYSFLRRMIRLCGMLQYTHVILEFWGMLKLESLDALSWPNAFSKEQVALLLREARAMGMEPVPMFNQLGHATACRVMNGKHVVLDQAPELQYLFSADGWAWNMRSEAVRGLLRNVRGELCQLFGPGKYFHVGCDEADIYGADPNAKEQLAEYLAALTGEVTAEGRTPILWGDMLLCSDEFERSDHCFCAEADPATAAALRSRLAPGTVIADWQYSSELTAPIGSTEFLVQQGIPTLCCPWDRKNNVIAGARTAARLHCGLIQTTWHTLSEGFTALMLSAQECGYPLPEHLRFAPTRTAVSMLHRKVSLGFESYEECGFAAQQVADRH